MAVNLYGASLFGNAYKFAVIRGSNNSPGGDGGVDLDVQYRLGADNSPRGKLDRRHGICCGITVAWIVGVCHRREDAVNTTNFENYFRNVLRFQGAYLKDVNETVGGMDELNGVHPMGVNKIRSGRCTSDELSGVFPASGTWAAYLGLYHHAVGIGTDSGTFSNRYLIMEPNGGLFKYKNKNDFITDVKQLCDVRRRRANGAAEFRYTFFSKA